MPNIPPPAYFNGKPRKYTWRDYLLMGLIGIGGILALVVAFFLHTFRWGYC